MCIHICIHTYIYIYMYNFMFYGIPLMDLYHKPSIHLTIGQTPDPNDWNRHPEQSSSATG